MRLLALLSALAPAVSVVGAIGVTGAAEGFAKGVTGGGSAPPVYPSTTAELVSYLGDSSPRVIVLSKTFDFRGTEGTATATGCAPYGTASACQVAINQNDWCTNYQPNAPKVTVSYDKAAVSAITVASDKTILGEGSKGVIIGKGLRIANGAKNVIIQNIHITNLNPQYVWGGDAITLAGTDLVWIDHVKVSEMGERRWRCPPQENIHHQSPPVHPPLSLTSPQTSLIGRQHIVLGTSASNRVTISNCDIDGSTSWSATCNGYHYWNLYFTGSSDLVTFKNNYVHHFSGRAPKVAGNTLLHAVNNYWYASVSSGHAFEIDSGAMVLAEGNIFQNVATVVESGFAGQAFASPSTSANAACKSALGRACEVNGFGSSGAFTAATTGFLANFAGKNVASASAYSSVTSVINTAGFGKI
jgi:pectin lyase